MSAESNGPVVSGNGAPTEPHILELRIHGVRDTPPWEILGVGQKDATMVAGDNLGSFWIPKKPANSNVPKDIRLEAYSWGAMARYAPEPGANFLGKGAAVVRRVGWLMMLPFALCNAAYWMRPLGRTPASKDRGWRDANGGGIVRVFGLFLTLLLVTSAMAASVDLIGNQCVRAGRICSTLPGMFNWLTSLNQLQRNLVLALLPLVLLLVIYGLSVFGRVRYSANVAAHPQGDSLPAGTMMSAETTKPQRPILQTPGFWYNPMMPRATELLHLTGSGALVTAMLAWDALYSPVPACRKMTTFFSPECGAGTSQWHAVAGSESVSMPSAIASRPESLIILLLAVALLTTVICRVLLSVTGNADVPLPQKLRTKADGSAWHQELLWAACLLGLVVVLGAANAAWMWFAPESAAATAASTQQSAPFLGVAWAPSLFILALLGMSVSGLGWRRGAGSTTSLLLFAGATAFLIAGVVVMKSATTPAGPAGLFAAAFLLAAGLLVHILHKVPGASHRQEGWHGMGPGIIMAIALGMALTLDSALVVGAANFLNGKLSLTGGTTASVMWRNVAVPGAPASGPGPSVSEVPIYDHYGFALLFTVFVVGLVLIYAIFRQIMGRLFVLSAPDPNSMPADGTTAGKYPDGRPVASHAPLGNVTRLVLEGRRTAALLHRVEHGLSWLAGAFLVVLAGALMWSLLEPSVADGGSAPQAAWIQQMSSVVLGFVALGLVGGIVVSSASSGPRPMGVLWDLMCFLPNAAHPFGPPCYAERVVPELGGRIDDWLASVDGAKAARKVVISAHSLGGVLAVASLFARQADNKDPTRIGLLTYGCQLRAYFGRFFPELFGPAVLGTPGTMGASLWAPDPWQKQVDRDFSADAVPEPAVNSPTLSRLLTVPGEGQPRWINLWRRTDFLGFPVKSYAENEIDRGADELDASSYMLTLATHSGYPSSRAYPASLLELLKRMGEPLP